MVAKIIVSYYLSEVLNGSGRGDRASGCTGCPRNTAAKSRGAKAATAPIRFPLPPGLTCNLNSLPSNGGYTRPPMTIGTWAVQTI